jgi:diguanylate cyclase (GGDEF)-like protein/PAS domain S-box-containing protein
VAVYITNARGRIIFFNKAAIEMAGRTPKVGVDKWCVTWKLYRPDGTRLPHNECAMAMALKQNRVIRGAEAIAERPDGTRVPFFPFSTPLRNAAGELIGSLSLLFDITYIKQAEQQLAYLADHDVLTGLPSRVVFSTRLSHVIEAAKTAGTNFAVVCLDLDRFKEINDAFGHAVGDEALKIVATRLKRAAPKFFIARIGGDAMIMIVPEAENEAALMRQLVAFQLAVGKKMHIADHVLKINFSAGVAQFPSRGADEIEIVANANAALRQAKRDGSGSLRFFDAKMERRMRDRACIQRDLRSTIDKNELQLHYQPLAATHGKVVGFEALIRWYHPKRGNISPEAFIPISEECGLIIPLSRWVLRQACLEAASWKRPLNVAVNLSPVQFEHEDLPALIKSVLSKTGLAPDRLELEITEGVLIADSERALATLEKLNKLGVQIVLDDFGTGYSSLSYLRDFPFSKIKIDRSFVAKIGVQDSAKAIIRAVIGLGHSMNLTVTAEGVETESQLKYLKDERCDMIQGYLIGRPAPIESFSILTGNVEKKSAFARGPVSLFGATS